MCLKEQDVGVIPRAYRLSCPIQTSPKAENIQQVLRSLGFPLYLHIV